MTDEQVYLWCEKGKSKSRKSILVCKSCKNSVNCDSYKKHLLKEDIEKQLENPDIKTIPLSFNSPGGCVKDAHEIDNKLKGGATVPLDQEENWL